MVIKQSTNSNFRLFKSKNRADKFSHSLSMTLSWMFAIIFFALIGFIIYASVQGFQTYGWGILGNQFDLEHNKASVWLPLCITLLISCIALLISAPIGIKTAIFIKYRLLPKYRKGARVTVEVLAAIPSVIFGLFATQSLGVLINTLFHIGSSYNLVTAGFMLAFMVLPTIVSLSLNALEGANTNFISAGMVLGNSKTKAIYKICKRDARNGITVGIIIALARAIGETMAVSMILQGQGYNTIFTDGFFSILTSGLRSLGVLISANMFAEGGGPALQSLLFAFGLFMFVFVMILNGVAMYATKQKNRSKVKWWTPAEKKIAEFVLFVPTRIKIWYEKLTYSSQVNINTNFSKYISTRISKNKFVYLYTGWKIFWEWFAIILTASFLLWITINILVNGMIAFSSGYATTFSFGKDTTGEAFICTLLIIVIVIGIGLPLSLMIAIYINEFIKPGKIKNILVFFIDSLGATPSILFGMFGLIFFIQTLGLTTEGVAGKSLIAGALTILIVILPVFVRTIQQALQSVSVELRTNSIALGAGKWETISKIVLPAARQGITTAVVLSIGRILAETAPLYLTSGLSSSSAVSLGQPGQTLTTRIYAQIYTSTIAQGTNIMYECALDTMIMVFLIILVVHVIIPQYYIYKQKRLLKQQNLVTDTKASKTHNKISYCIKSLCHHKKNKKSTKIKNSDDG